MMRLGKLLAGVALAGFALTASAARDHYRYTIHGQQGQDVGTVTLSPARHGGVHVKIELHGLFFGPHAVHFHEYPLCDAPDFHSAGGHFNPFHKEHGYLNPLGHHAGDIPVNVMIDEDHMGEISVNLPDLSLDPNAPNSVFGTSLIVHAHGDDMKTDPSGDSGNRVACAVIARP